MRHFACAAWNSSVPPPIVPGPRAHEELKDYFVAANLELQSRLERIRSLYEQGRARPLRAVGRADDLYARFGITARVVHAEARRILQI